MAYIPPHKRHLKDGERPVPTPSSLLPHLERNLNPRSSSNSLRRKDQHSSQGGKIVYSKSSISRWWAVCLTDDGHFPSLVQLEEISCEPFERRRGEKPLALVCHQPSEAVEVTESFSNRPWLSIVEMICGDLGTCFQNVMTEMLSQESEVVKPSFVARFGKILFDGGPSINLEILENILKNSAPNSKNQVSKSFYTTVPSTYMEAVQHVVVPKIGFDFEREREHYHVKIHDKSRPNATISCKCSIVNGGLELHKVALNQVRHLVADISCLDMNLDLRLMLTTKRILTALTDEEEHGIKELLKSAVLDSDVRGGLRWPLGKETFGDRFSVVGVWHTKYKAFKGLMMRLYLRDADRFDFLTSAGEVSREVTLKMVGISKLLRDGTAEMDVASKTLCDALKMIWGNFLSFDCLFS